METIVRFFINNAKFTTMLTIIVFVGGLMGLGQLNSESFPNVNLATAIIETEYRGAAPEDIETKITKPIENKIREVSGLKDVRSVSQTGKSRIIVRVDMDHYDVEKVMADVEQALDQVNDLPPDLIDEPKFLEIKSEEFPAIEIAVVGNNTNRARDLVADRLREDLEDNKLVKNVVTTGFLNREFVIQLNKSKLDLLHVGIDEVLAKIAARNVDVPGGDLEQNGQKTLIRVKAKVQSSKDLENLLIRSNFSGQGVYLKDIATVLDSEQEAKIITRTDGLESTLLTVNKKAGADTLKLVNEVDGILKQYQNTYGNQLKFLVYNNEAEKVKNRLSILSSNALSGLALVVTFLLIFLPGRIGVMASLSLPIAVMATFGLMPAYGMNLDAITILALVIALGMLVDNSVVISENFARLIKEGLDSTTAAVRSVKELALPITATAFTTIAAFLPMLVTKGVMGQFIKYIPIVVTIALALSLLEGFFLLPLRLKAAQEGWFPFNLYDALLKRFYPRALNKTTTSNEDWFDRFRGWFERTNQKLLQHKYLTALGFSIMILGSFIMLGVVNKFVLFPAEQTEVYIGRFEAPRGTSLKKTNEYTAILSSKVKEALGAQAKFIIAKAGSSFDDPTDPMGKEGDNVGAVYIYVTEDAKLNLSYKDALDKLRAIQMPELSELVFEARINGPPVGTPINATFRSNDLKSLNAAVDKIKSALSKEPGVMNLKTNDELGEDQIFVDIDYIKTDQLGLSVQEVGTAIRTAFSGTIVSDVTLKNKEVDLRVKYHDNYRTSLTDLYNIRVTDRRGNLVPLSQIAKLKKEGGAPIIKRFDYKRSKALNGYVDENVTTSAVANAKLQEQFDQIKAEHPDVSLVFGGEAESTNESMQSLGRAMILALLGIFALLVFVFNSFVKPLIIMSTIPLGLVGFSVAFFLHQRPVSFLAMIGTVGLAGIIVNSGIVLISFIDEMRANTKLDLNTILVQASGLRLRAVMVTSITTISGLFPTAYGIGGTDAILVPMTLAMAWGLTTGTLFTLFWVPVAYAILYDLANKLDIVLRGESGKDALQTNHRSKQQRDEPVATL